MSDFDLSWVEEYNIKPTVVFDIGAYDGGDAVRFKTKYPDSEVYAFEACPDNFKYFLTRAIPHGVKIFHYAMCDRVGSIEFTSSASPIAGNGSGSIHAPNDLLRTELPHINFYAKRDVPCTTIEHFCQSHNINQIDVVHMDVQGAEGQVMSGLGSFRPKLVFLETTETTRYDGPLTVENLNLLMHSLGYELVKQLRWDNLYLHKGG